MGKHERKRIETREKHLICLINGEEDSAFAGNLTEKDLALDRTLAQKIKKKFPKTKKAEHIGNIYGNSLGDIKLIQTSKPKNIFLEIKFIKSGYGTRANISQNALTTYGIFKNAVSWSSFRDKEKHDLWVFEKLSEFQHYETADRSVKATRPLICRMAKELKEFAKRKDAVGFEAEKIKKAIMERDRHEKLKYLNYLSNQNVDYDNLKKFAILILTGNHTASAFYKFANTKVCDIQIPDNYFIIYAYDTGKFYLEEIRELISKIQNSATSVGISFSPQQTNIKIYISYGNGKKYLLRIVLHWKNKFQGIETPCLNIFDEYGKKLTEI